MATKAISVTELKEREMKTKKPTSAIGKPAGTRPVSSKSAPSGGAMKPTDPKAAAPAAAGKTKVSTKEQQEAERKKRLEEKRLKDKEKADAMAEKRKALEEKKKQELTQKLAKGKPTSTSSRPVSGTSKTAASTKPSPKPTATKIPVGKKPVEATDGPRPKAAGGVSKKPVSGDAAATTTQIPNGSATTKKPRASTTPTTTTAARPLRTKPGSAGTTPTTRPASSRPATTKAASASLASKSDSTIPKPQKPIVKTSSLASTRTTTSAPAKASRAGASSTRSPVKSRVGATSAPSGGKKAGTPTGIPSSRIAKPSLARPSPKQATSTPGAAGAQKTPTKTSGKIPIPTATTTTTTTTSAAAKKGTTSKSPGRPPVKTTTPGKIPSARPGSGAGVKAPSGQPTKKTSRPSPLGAGKKVQPKATGSKIEKKTEKKPAEKKTAVAEEKPVENEAVESNGLAEKNDVPQVVGTSATPEGADHNGPRPEIADATLPAFTPATAERVGQIISSQTSLSKELQSKLPRLGEAIGGTENTQASAEEGEIASQSDLQDTGTVDVTAVAVATISTEVKDLPEGFSAEWKQEKERKEQEEVAEREERSKRVDEIMNRTHAEAAQMDLVEGKVNSTSPPPTEQEVADAPPSSSTLLVGGDQQEQSPSPTLPIIPDSSAGGSETLPEPDVERGTISAQDSFEFSPAPSQSQPPSVEPLVEGAEEKGLVTEEPVGMSEVPTEPEEPKVSDIVEPELESPSVSVPTPTEEPTSTEPELETPLIEVPMPSEPETLKPEPEAPLIEVPMLSEDVEIEAEASPTEIPKPTEVPDIPDDEIEPEPEVQGSIPGDEPVIPAIHAPVEQEEEIDAMVQEGGQPSPEDAEEGRDLAEELGAAEEKDSVIFEEEETTSGVLEMLPEDTGKDMRQMIDDATQRIRAIEEQNEFDSTQGDELQLATPSDSDVAPPLPSEPPPDLLSSDFAEGPQGAPAITSEVPVADLFNVEQSMDAKESAQTTDVRMDDPFSVGELTGKEAPLVDPFSIGEPAAGSEIPVMDPFSVGGSTASDPFAMAGSTNLQPALLSSDDSTPAQGPGLDVDLLGGLGGDSAPPPANPFGSVQPSPFGVDLLGLSEPAPQDKPAVLVDNTAPSDPFGLCAAPEPAEVQPLSAGADLLGEPLLSTEAPPPHPPVLEGDLLEGDLGQEGQVPILAPEVQFEAERSPPSEGDLPNDVTPEPSEEDVLSPSPPVPGATPPLPDSPPPLSPSVEGLPSPPADDDVPSSPPVDDDPSTPSLPADAPPSPPADDDPSPPPLPADVPPLSPSDDDPSSPPLPADSPPSPPADDDPSPPPLPADDPPSPPSPSPSPPPLPVDEPPSPPADDDPLPPPLPADGPPTDEDFPPEVELQPADGSPVETTLPPLVETENYFGQSVVSGDAEESESA